jgi:hypothetical protein
VGIAFYNSVTGQFPSDFPSCGVCQGVGVLVFLLMTDLYCKNLYLSIHGQPHDNIGHFNWIIGEFNAYLFRAPPGDYSAEFPETGDLKPHYIATKELTGDQELGATDRDIDYPAVMPSCAIHDSGFYQNIPAFMYPFISLASLFIHTVHL